MGGWPPQQLVSAWVMVPASRAMSSIRCGHLIHDSKSLNPKPRS